MYKNHKKQTYAIISMMIIITLVVVIPAPVSNAQFVISTGSYPNEYGEGIFTVMVFENSTSEWLDVGYSAPSGNFLIGQKILNWSDWANQGVTQDGTYVYSSNATHIMKYTKAGTFISMRNCVSDSTLGAGWGMGGLCYVSDYLYITAHNSDSSNSTILKYSVLLAFIAEYDTPEPTVANNLGAGGIAYHDGYFWAISDTNTDHADFQITQYDTDMSLVAAYPVTGFDIVDSWHYQGIDWYDDFILCNVHDGSEPQLIDIYKWSGSGFNQVGRIEQPLYGSEGTTNWMSQDISIEIDGGITYIWFASRKTTNAENEVAKYRLLINSASSNTFDIAVNTDIKLDARVTLNFTRLGLSYPSDVALGTNYMRINATISVAGTTIFSQENFTYSTYGLFEEGIVWYSYTLILHNIFVTYGAIYIMTITYEIYGW